VAHRLGAGLEGRQEQKLLGQQPTVERNGHGSVGKWWAVEPGICFLADELSQGMDGSQHAGDIWWNSEWPGVPRTAKGIKNRVDRLRGLGNAIVPAIAELIGRTILQCEAAESCNT
jgi:hypothetical protein